MQDNRQASHRDCLRESRNAGTTESTDDNRNYIRIAGQHAGMAAILHVRQTAGST
ncbi:MAG TPA: hypothetical protein GXX42_01925 [Petrimonas sp.]|uniref:hypothetical protein n=1 Tax=Petrimonas sp. TaxID=2023866 RepID=UPI00175636B8|nr:hypothetical protein [Petrimonas sp.]